MHFIEGIINRASEGGVDFLLEGDKLTLKMLQDREIDSSLLTLIRENKESIKSFLRDNAVPANGAAGNRKVTPVTNGHGPSPLSFAQERLWFIDRLHGSLPYHMPWVFNLRGNLHREHLESSFRQIVQRHEVLRTVVREEDGVGYPAVLPAEQWQLKTIHFDGGQPVEQLIERLINTPFDLSDDFMLKVWLVKITEREHLLVTLFHHIAFDGWSISIMVKELEELYRNKIDNNESELRALPVQYSDYAYWQRKYLSGQVLETKLGYWKRQLSGVSVVELPADHARPAIQSTKGAVVSSRIDKEVYRQLLDLSRQEGVTLFMTMLSAFKVLLYKYTGQTDICIGSPTAGRQQQEVEGLIGFFVNTLALRNEVDEKRSFKEFLQQVKQTTLEAYDHQEVPFEKIVEVLGVQRDMSRTPVFQLMFALHNMPLAEELKLGDVQLWRKPDSRLSARFDLELEITESADGLVLSAIYCRDLFNEATVRQLLLHYECLLQNILFEPAAAITELNILTAKDLRQVLHLFNDTEVSYPKDKTVVDLFVEQARNTPNAVAVVFEDEQLTYRELDELSNQLAHLLVSKGVGQEALVPVCLDRSLDMLVVIFGIWKAGAAYVPIDPLHPASRIQYMLEDCKATIAVCHKGYDHFFANTVALEDAAAMPVTPISKAGANNLSYLIYTSGSTGQPKGVMIEHRSLLNFLLSMQFELELTQADNTIALTTYSFDISCLELYLGLICGGTVHIASQWQLKDGYALKELVEKVKPSYMQATPSGWQLLLESGWQNNNNTTILTGGEAISDALKETLTSISGNVFNMYGPTETTIWSAMHRLQQGKKVSIGTPIANTKIYILNSALQPCPIGVQGELCIGGDGLSRGYLNKAELTTEKFIDNPFIKGENIYKTGDVARWNTDGTLEYLGRKDEQVKVRGYRIELGEIETVLNRAPGVQQAVVVAVKDSTGSNQLVAYAITAEGFDKASVTSYLRQFLPEYMVPSLLFETAELPLTPNGKVDRKKLRELQLTHTTAAYEAPRNQTEQTLADIWQELLNITKLSIHDNFFESGGHSLLAMRMISMIRKRLGKEIAIKEVFLHPTIAQLSTASQNDQLIPAIERQENTGLIPLSFSQERLWFIDKLQGSLQYHMPYVFRMKGNINAHALEASFREILNRHEVLRTVISEEDGKGYQKILPVNGWHLHHATRHGIDAQYGSIANFIETSVRAPFNLAAGPMFKVWLIEVSAQEHILFAMLHHIVFDGWSVGIMVEELVELYGANVENRVPALKLLPVQYADYAAWQRKYLSGEVLEQKVSYWKKQLQDITPLELPADNPRPVIQSTNGALFTGIIEKETLAGLNSLSQQQGTTLFMTLLSAFNVLLYKYCGQEDVCVGSAVAGRNQQETEGLIGFFINTIALRNGVNGNATFRQLLQQVKQTTLDAYNHQDVPFEKIVEALEIPRDLGRTPVFQVMFTLQNAPHAAELKFSDILLTEEKPATIASRFELGFSLTETAAGLEISVTYCRDLYNESTIARMLRHYERLLTAVINNADAVIDQLQMLPQQESAHLLEVFGSSLAPYPKGNKTIVDLFEEQAAKTPDNIAVAFEGSQLTYRQLDEYSNKIAHYLVQSGVRREELVVISVKRSLECVAGIMGILKAGAAYVPVDTNYPDERIAYIVTDTACKVFLGDNSLSERLQLALPGNNVQFIDLKHDAALIDASPANHINLSDTHQLVYIIYTSGSTGLPKGVMIEHAHLVDHVYGMFKSARLNTCRSFALFASLVADAGHSILFSALISGGAVHVLSDELLTDGEAVSNYIEQHRIECLKIVPSLWLSYLDSNFVPLPGKVLIFGGEAFALNILDILRQRNYKGALYNHYGPTEATIGKCIHKIDLTRNYHNVPIGQPFSNTKAYIVNSGGQLCPIGVCGELYLGGEGIARGYLNRAELTSQRFIADPFCEGGKVYKTGDICRWLPDGNIEYMGRKDDQVKVRGHRIELGEIESVLQQFPGIVQAVVALSEDGKRLVSCIVAQAQTNKEQLAAYMRSKLPDYMVPAVITQVDAIPLTANGKLDRKKLQQLSAEAASLSKEYTAPTNDAEHALAAVWQELLGVEKAGIHDNFFELGGDSIITIQVVSRMKRRGYELKPKDLFLHQTIARLSKVMRKTTDAVAAPRGEQGLLQGKSPLLPVQQSYFDNATGNISHFNQSVLLAIDKRISAAALQSVIQVLQDQHDALRFTYRNTAAGWVQEYGAAEGKLIVEDVATLAAITPLAENYQRSLDIEKGGLMRAVLFTTPAGETHNRLLVIIHHLGVDSVSWRILMEDLEQLLQLQQEGKPLATGVKSSSYRQWHEALAKYGESHQLQSQIAYWESVCSSVEPLPVDKQYAGVVLAENIDTVEVSLSPEHTQQLLQDVHKAYNTGINDILLAALAKTISAWSGTDRLTIGLEGHGREQVTADVDVSRTVGWFTSLYPVLLEIEGAESNGDLLKSIKEQLRSVPEKGIGYGVLKHIKKQPSLQNAMPWELVFNYLGQADNVAGGKYFAAAQENAGREVALDRAVHNKMEIVSIVQDGSLKITWKYSSKHYHKVSVAALADQYVSCLQQLTEHCLQQAAQARVFTPADFNLGSEITFRQLDNFMAANPGVESIYRLSALQQGMLFHGLYDKGSSAYIEQFCCELVGLNTTVFTNTWDALVQRHTILRTAFYHNDFSVPVQCVHAQAKLSIDIIDYSGLSKAEQELAAKEYSEAERARGFDFRNAPLMRISLVRLTEDRYAMVWTFHHILFDGWSMPVLMEEFLNCYEQLLQGQELSQVETDRYEDYIRYLENRDTEKDAQYWKTYLDKTEQGSLLPFIRTSAGRLKGVGSYREELLELGEELTNGIASFAREHRITINTVMQAAWAYLLYRYTGNADVIYGVTVSGRPADLAGVEQRVGMYINSIPFRTSLQERSLAEWLQDIQQNQLSSRDFGFSAITDIQDWAGIKQDLFDTILVFENYPVSELLSAKQWALKVENTVLKEHNNYPLSVEITNGKAIEVRFNYNEDLLTLDYAQMIAGHFKNIVRQIASGSAESITELSLLSHDEEKQLLVDFNNTATDYPKHSNVVELFEEQVASSPSSTALVFETTQLTYSELDELSSRLANFLRGSGVKEESLVAVCMNRSAELIISILAILKAGGAYVPIDPSYPAFRISYMLEDISATVLLTHSSIELPAGICERIDIDKQSFDKFSPVRPAVQLQPSSLAYVLYTSGSTGTPKGVQVEHKNIVSLVKGVRFVELTGNTVILSTGSPSFDATTIEYWGALLNGGKLVMCAQETLLDTVLLKQAIDEQDVNTMWFTAGWFNELAETGISLFSNLTTILVGGDKLSPAHIAQVKSAYPSLKIINGYGPTENTTFSLTYCINEVNGEIPIGYPLSNRKAYVLDEQLRLCPVGVAGEIYVGGDGLSRGYLDKEQLTKQKFIKDPFSENERLYRTGDLGRWTKEGSIEYLGRKDEQVKIRGYRIELGEIENALQQLAEVQQAVVLAVQDGVNKKLIAYAVASNDFSADEAMMHLQSRLPEYMVPAAIITVDAMPLTANGKVDRKKLQESEIATTEKQHTAPRNETEKLIAGIWKDILEVESIGIDDNFFELGGHSLLAIRAIAAMRSQLEKEVSIKELFDHPTIKELAAVIAGYGNESLQPSIVKHEGKENVPLSFSQERLWFIDKLHGSVQYHMPWVFSLKGELDVTALENSFASIVSRHEVLRTVIREHNGVGVQVVRPAEGWKITQLQLQGQSQEQLVKDLIAIPFDLANDFMLRVWLVKLSANEHLLITVFHHIAFDGWSIGVMVKELEELYKGQALPGLAIQYSDYAAWQRNYLSGQVLDTKLSYWKNKLSGVEPLELPLDRVRPAIQSMRGAMVKGAIDRELADRLQEISQSQGATLFMTLCSAFNILLHKYTGQQDICIGSPIAGRQQQETGNLVGFFVNTLVLRNEIKADQSFIEILQQVKQATLDAYENQDVPFEKIVEALGVQRDMSRTPVFQVMFALQNMPAVDGLNFPNLQVTAVEDGIVNAKFDLGLSISESAQGLQLEIIYCADLFEEATVQALLQHYMQLLHSITNTSATVAKLAIMSNEEQQQLLQNFSNLTEERAAYPFTLQSALDEQLKSSGNHIAIQYKDRTITYNELHAGIGKISWFLRKKLGLNKGEKVVVMVNRSEKLILTILSVLRSGLVYVPIDTSYPEERALFMIRDAQPSLIITDGECTAAERSGCQSISIDDILSVPRAGTFYEQNIEPAGEAYVLYTSGSTGAPKGVVVTHGNLDHLFEFLYVQYVHTRPIVPFVASHSFDISLFQLYLPLLSGGAVLVIDREQLQDVEQLVTLLQQSTIIDTVPGLYKLVLNYIDEHNLAENFNHIERVFVGGDLIPDDLMHQLGQVFCNASITVSYGPTEGTIFCTSLPYAPGSITSSVKGTIIGSPLGNAQLYVLGQSQELLPAGVEGEICIGGPPVSKGYLNQPELTAEKYLTNPFKPTERIYRTGDTGRWTRDGQLEFRGRNDNQVKIRGNRIELGELENKIKELNGISEAVVTLARKENGEAYLCAFYTGTNKTRAAFESHLTAFFAESVLPSHYLHIDEVPLTSNGKVDRKKLQELAAGEAIHGAEYAAPRNQAEQSLAEVWQDLLGVQQVSIHDNFFQLGGDSIITIQVVSRLRRKGYELQPKDIFLHQTIARLCPVMLDRKAFAAVQGEQGILKGNSPLLPVQQWYFEKAPENISHFNQSLLLGIDKSITAEALGKAVKAVVQHHDALRFHYHHTTTGWQQEYGAAEGQLIVEELTCSEELVAEEIRHLANIYQRSLDIEDGRLVKLVLIKTPTAETHNRLLAIIHHLVIDGVSWRILIEDLEQLLRQQPLGLKGSSYRQWHDALQKYSHSNRIKKQIDYWENAVSNTTPLPVDSNYEEVAENSPAGHTLRLSKEHTQQLLQQAGKAYHTGINDLLLAALAQTIATWSNTNHITIGLEAHGREDIAAKTDLSRTVGWFTSVFPLVLNTEGITSQSELVKSVKEQIRCVPDKGLGYGVLKYMSRHASLQGSDPWEIVFNYLGQSDNVISSPFFTAAKESTGDNVAEGSVQRNKMEVSAIVEDGALKINWRYSTKHYRESTICTLANNFVSNLEKLVQHCVTTGPVHTPSDFGLGREVSFRELDAFMESLPEGTAVQSIYRLSGLQEGMLFHGLYNQGSGAYMEQFCADLINPDINIFTNCWQQILDRHTILRSSFHSDAFSIPVQCVHAGVTLPVEIIDYRSIYPAQQDQAVKEFIAADRDRGFNFKQPPLMRITLLQLSDERFRMVWTFHHILFDGWSMPVLMEEFLKNYEGESNGTGAEDRFEEFIRYVEAKDQDQEKEYWQQYLGNVERGSFLPFIDITKERTKSAGVYAEQFAKLDKDLTSRLRAYARQHRLTVNTIMQGVWSYLLYRYTGDAKVTYGVTVSGRPEDLPGVERRVGMYINTLPLHTLVEEENNIVEWLNSLQQEQLASRQYQHSALARVQEWAGIKGELFDTIMVFENYPVDKMVASRRWKLQVENIRALGKTNYPLSILIDAGEEINACFKYNTSILDPVYVQKIAAHFRQVLLQFLNTPAGKLGDVEMIMPAERSQLLHRFGWCEVDYPRTKTMLDLFERQAKRQPETLALVCGRQQLTYKELDQRTNQLAQYLRSIGIKENSCVPLCIDRPFESIIAILSILKAGGAYVPVDPDSPRSRMEYVFGDTGSNVLLTNASCRKLISHAFDHIIEIDDCDALVAKLSKRKVSRRTMPEDLLYVIYTSGSTGAPKGVMVKHQSIMDYAFGLKEKTRIHECSSFALVSAIFTDLGNTVIYSSLIFGGTLHVFGKEMINDPAAMCNYFENHQVDCVKIVPSHWKALSSGEKMLLPARWLVFGGEALHAEVVEKITGSGAACGIVNHYGPTETTIGKLLHVVEPGRTYGNTVPIGRPFSNTRVYVLSANGQLCPLGVTGELFIGGDGVAAGYINNLSLTNEKFIPDHFSNIPGATMYRTGDVVKYLPDGNILFIGRADNQVKIRGYRVEPGEIESVLQQAPNVANGVVTVHEDSHSNKRLIAYVTGEGIDKESVMLYLRSRLPEYMVPPVLMQIAAIPLTANGKIDRRKLPAPDMSARSSSYHAPRNAVELQLAEIWQELLGVERVGIHDNFFELGGNSLLVMRMDAYIKRSLQISIPMQVLFQLSSINEISKYLDVEMQAGKQEDAGFEIVTI